MFCNSTMPGTRVFFALCFVLLGNCIASTEINFQTQSDFLCSLLDEIEQTSLQNFSGISQEELDAYVGDIKDLKSVLHNIKLEQNRRSENSDELHNLVDEYNRKMKALENSYKFIMFHLKKSKPEEDLPTSSTNTSAGMDSLNYGKKQKLLGDKKQFQLIDLVEVPSKPSSSGGAGMLASKTNDEE